MVRYADDFVILCRSEAEARQALERVQELDRDGGTEAASDQDADRGRHAQRVASIFWGITSNGGNVGPDARAWKVEGHDSSQDSASNGQSLPAIITNLNRTLRGWFEYFQHSRKFVFADLDHWVRRRLRGILRHRKGGHGCGGGWDNVHWPPAFFAKQGLFSLVTAHALACQPARWSYL